MRGRFQLIGCQRALFQGVKGRVRHHMVEALGLKPRCLQLSLGQADITLHDTRTIREAVAHHVLCCNTRKRRLFFQESEIHFGISPGKA